MKGTYSRQISLLAIATPIAFALQPYITLLLEHLVEVFHWISQKLMLIFTHGYWGDLIRLSLSTLAISLLVSGSINGIYFLVRKRTLPNPMLTTWCIWLLIIARIT